MVYTLVSATTLGFDLARLPAGAEVAEVLLTGLLADRPALSRLARQHRTHCVLDDPRSTPRADAGQARRARELAASGGASSVFGPGGAESAARVRATPSAALVAQLERSTLGDAAALERLVRTDLVEAPGDVDERTLGLAREVLADAAVAAYASSALPADLRLLLRAAYDDGAGAPRPVPADDLGPHGAAVLAALESVAGGAQRAWRSAAGSVRLDPGAWARAMHEACWAAHVAGRTRATAAAQLLAVRALHAGGFTAADAAGGLWNALAGVVQALALADVLPDDVRDLLLAPWHHVLGATG